MSARGDIAAAYASLRQPAAAGGVQTPARARVSVDAVLAELLEALADAFAATSRVISAVTGSTWPWVEDYLRSPELAARPASTRFATLGQLAVTFPSFVRRASLPIAGASAALLRDALAGETAINELRAPDPLLAAILHRLRGPFADPQRLLTPEALPAAPAVALASHARLGAYGRDVASLMASARSRLAGMLPPREWAAALDTHPGLSVRAGAFHAVHVLRPSGEVMTLQIGEATAARLAGAGADPRDASGREDLVRLAAAGALRAQGVR